MRESQELKFNVADLMDRIHNASKKVEDTNSVFFSVSMN
jgi:hypothetical protein